MAAAFAPPCAGMVGLLHAKELLSGRRQRPLLHLRELSPNVASALGAAPGVGLGFKGLGFRV